MPGLTLDLALVKPKGGRRSKRAGYVAEKRVETALEAFGFRRMVMSGALGGELSGDLRRPKGKTVTVLEVKRRKGQQTQLRRWVTQGGADALVIDTGAGAELLVVMLLGRFHGLLVEGGYETAPDTPPDAA